MVKTFTYSLVDMYSRDNDQFFNIVEFVDFAKNVGFGDLLFWPNYTDAPWHLQMNIADSVINFWPHKLKAHVQYEPKSEVANGDYEIACLVCRVLLENHKQYDDSVLE